MLRKTSLSLLKRKREREKQGEETRVKLRRAINRIVYLRQREMNSVESSQQTEPTQATFE